MRHVGIGLRHLHLMAQSCQLLLGIAASFVQGRHHRPVFGQNKIENRRDVLQTVNPILHSVLSPVLAQMAGHPFPVTMCLFDESLAHGLVECQRRS